MTLKLKSGTNELRNGCTLAWHHNFTHIANYKELRGLRKKQDAFRVQTGESLLKYEGFGRKLIYYNLISFLISYLIPYFLCVLYATFKGTSSIFNTFWLHLIFFMHLMVYFELNDPKIEKWYKWTLKRLYLGMTS